MKQKQNEVAEKPKTKIVNMKSFLKGPGVIFRELTLTKERLIITQFGFPFVEVRPIADEMRLKKIATG